MNNSILFVGLDVHKATLSVAVAEAVGSVVWASDTNGSAFFGGRDRRIAGPAGDGTATRARAKARSGEGSSHPRRTATSAPPRAGTRGSR